MELKELTKQLDVQLTTDYNHYLDLHEQLKPYGNRLLSEEENVKANELLNAIAESFREMYPTLHLIAARYQFVVNVTNSYDSWLSTLEKAGIVKDELPEEKKIIIQ